MYVCLLFRVVSHGVCGPSWLCGLCRFAVDPCQETARDVY